MQDRLNPVRPWERGAELEHALLVRNCQSLYGVAAMLILFFGAVFAVAVPGSVDPWPVRISLAFVCGSLLVATSYVDWLRRFSTRVAAALVFVLTGWFIVLTALNDFSAVYGLGLVFTIAAIAFALLMTQSGVRPVLLYVAASVATIFASVLVVRPAGPAALLTVGAAVGISLVVVLFSRLRTFVTSSLESSERRFRRLSEAAFEAIFITDGDVIVDCNANALLLLGHSSRDRLLGCKLTDFMPHSGRTSREVLGEPDGPYRLDSTMLRSDGTPVPVEIRGRSDDERGRDLRVVAVRDISEQKEYERQLIESRRRVEETLKVRTAILTNVSHEFRTPLAIMLGYAEMLKEGTFDEAPELGRLIYDSGKKLNDTLNLILELAQIEGGGSSPGRSSVNLAEVVEDVIRSHRHRASQKLLGLRFNVDESDHVAFADRVRVLKIVDHLVDNAIKFTDEGTVDVCVDSDPEWTRIVVKDSGIGIEESFIPNVFEPFKQESSGLTRSHGGLGVGLAIARRLAESMRGTIMVDSKKGEGSTFTVIFPKTASDHPLPAGVEQQIYSAQIEEEGSAGAVWM